MRKALIILLSALLVLSFFVACSGEAEDLFGTKVTFDGNGSTSGSMSPVMVKMGETITLPANSYARTGYVFNGWNTRADGTGTPYADKARSGFGENTTLYAQWLEIYPITEDTTILVPGNYYTTVGPETVISESIIIGDGTGEVFIILAEGTILEVRGGIAVREGQTLNIMGSGKLVAQGESGSAGIGGTGFSGDCGTINIIGGTIIATGGVEAAGIGGGAAGDGGIVSISGGDVTANGGLSGGAGIGGGKGGDGAIVSITGGTVNAFGSVESVSEKAASAIGAGIGGSSDGTLEIGEGLGLFGGDDVEDAKFLSGPTDSYVGESFGFMGTKVSVLVKIIFDANGGEGEMAPQAVAAGIQAELNVNLFDKADMFFDGWNTDKGGTGTSYKDMDNITTDSDVTLYAQWTDVPPFVYLDSKTTVLEDGLYYTITENLTLENRLVVDGKAKIYLPDGKTLTAQKGITVSKGKALEINAFGTEGTGKLVAGTTAGNAAIGGTIDTTITTNTRGAGTIVIKGGVIEATGYNGGAAIGGAENGTGGRITITGGTVTAYGGDGAAGIGGGFQGSGVMIVISGGKVKAYGMDTGAGIGGGGYGEAGEITISGGTVDAFAGSKGAAIGGGYKKDGGRITISGGTVTATGDDSVGIGGILTIGSGIGLYGGADKASAVFLSVPTESYEGNRPLYMETRETDYVTVTFKSNGGKETEDKLQEVPEGIATALEANTFTHATSEFDNWNTKPDASGTAFADKQVVTLDKDLTLYAHWAEELPLDNTYGGPSGKKLKSGTTYTITEDLTIDGRLMIEGRKPVTIIIPKNTTLTLSKGINVTDKQNLVIEGEGTLIANAAANSGDAAIGGNSDAGAGIITINGGNVIATGSEAAAAIGGGYKGAGGTVTISGGTVTATGGEGSVGIGAGNGSAKHGSLAIGEGMGLYGGADKASAVFIGFPAEEYEGKLYVYMEARPTEYATVKFDANGGRGTMDDQIVPKSIATALNANGFRNAPLNFSGWAKTPTGTKAYGNKAKIEIDSDITLYAIWLPVIPLDDSYGGPDGKKLQGGKQYTINEDLTIAGRLYMEGTGAVTITLPEEGTLTLSSGLEVAEGQSVIIEGEGSLVAKAASSGDAGIGGSRGASGGTITIKGGIITAAGAAGTGTDGGGAGIGGGHNGSGGTVIISGGTVKASGGGAGTIGGGGAGIGSGNNGNALGSVSGGTITISGGTVKATGGATNIGHGGAGLGGGNYADGANVTITGGTVTATAAPGAVGIGAGNGSTTPGSLEIGEGLGLYGGTGQEYAAFLSAPTKAYGGERPLYMETKATTYVKVTFNANGGSGSMDAQSVPSGIDAPLNENEFTHETLSFAGWTTTPDGEVAYSDKAKINITANTTLYAKWVDVFYLDKDTTTLVGGMKYSIKDDLTITNRLRIDGTAEVTILLPKDKTLTLSKGIDVLSGKSLIIDGDGTLIATGADYRAGIGSRDLTAAGTITIKGGTIIATGGSDSAGIGGGWNCDGGTVIISGGTVTATGGAGVAGIGKGQGASSDGTLKIGEGLGLYGGADKDHADFLSAPVDSYEETRPVYMETKATEYVTVTFNANDAKASGKMDPQSVPKGVSVALKANAFTHATLSFNGWNTKADGTGTPYSNKQKVTLESNLTLYAQWVDIVYLTADITMLDGGKTYSIQDNLSIPNRLTIDGSEAVTIILPKDKTLELAKGISVTGGKSLIIDGEGTLTATGDGSGNALASAGIGGSMNETSCGTVTIKGGIVNASGGGKNGAGIGGGYNWGNAGSGGTVNILGGTVTATGAEYGGAGIGGGGGDGGHGGKVTISGGTVIATATGSSAGIGGGNYSNGGTVTITGGTVTATGGNDAAGIGGGYIGNGGTVEISGNNTIVTAIGGSGAAGIGGGSGSESLSRPGGNGGNVTISGGTVTATGGNHAAGIGGATGNAGYPAGNGGTVTISGGTVTATGGAYAAGIGGGGSYNNTKGGDGGTVTITGGTVTATGKDKAAGIGGGGSECSDADKNNGAGDGATVVITGGTVKATGGSSDGVVAIGAGHGKYWRPDTGSLKIGSGLGLFGGENQSKSQFRAFPTDSYTGTLYAYMEAKPTEYVTITFNGNGGTGEMASQKMVKDLAAIALSANAFTSPSSDIFSGWATSASGPVVYPDKGTIDFSKDTTLYAIWSDSVKITEYTTKLVAGANHTIDSDLTLSNRLYLDGSSATITLPAGKTLTLSHGIDVPKGKALVIEGSGTMIASGADKYLAAIGGGFQESCGSVTINGGTITATGGERGAGIGGGGSLYDDVFKRGEGGDITITGGTVTAQGGAYAAGIGGGNDAIGGRLTVSGGKVTATGGLDGAGIGGGNGAAGADVTISGGSVTATGGADEYYSAMGIGTGVNTGSGSTDQGTLTLTGVTMEVSDNGTSWSDYVAPTRHRYMKTK